MIRNIEFKNKQGFLLRGFISEPKKYHTAVIFLHGFPSNCQGNTASRLLRAAAKTDYLVLIFSFSHSPPSEGKFENKLMSKEVEDIKSAVDFVAKNYSFRQLVLMGHSTGAIDAALYAHKDKRINKVILTGAVSDLKNAVRYDFTDEQVYTFWKKGHIIYNRPGKWVHRKMLKKAFYDEFFTLDIPATIKKYKQPLLIVHGERDTIPVGEPQALFKLANKPKKFVIIRDADHSFNQPEHFKKLLKVVRDFIEK